MLNPFLTLSLTTASFPFCLCEPPPPAAKEHVRRNRLSRTFLVENVIGELWSELEEGRNSSSSSFDNSDKYPDELESGSGLGSGVRVRIRVMVGVGGQGWGHGRGRGQDKMTHLELESDSLVVIRPPLQTLQHVPCSRLEAPPILHVLNLSCMLRSFKTCSSALAVSLPVELTLCSHQRNNLDGFWWRTLVTKSIPLPRPSFWLCCTMVTESLT